MCRSLVRQVRRFSRARRALSSVMPSRSPVACSSGVIAAGNTCSVSNIRLSVPTGRSLCRSGTATMCLQTGPSTSAAMRSSWPQSSSPDALAGGVARLGAAFAPRGERTGTVVARGARDPRRDHGLVARAVRADHPHDPGIGARHADDRAQHRLEHRFEFGGGAARSPRVASAGAPARIGTRLRIGRRVRRRDAAARERPACSGVTASPPRKRESVRRRLHWPDRSRITIQAIMGLASYATQDWRRPH